ncbi:hypothetical protein IFM89_034723 [Coptis chinensis]|uniref:Histone H2B n=1 Tax=Coptis chinensis TaxID=261450 RepID=A0A835H6Z3_9MAGN|nr:hypothetical protein IFM89_034723 [Coptis chinensis]
MKNPNEEKRKDSNNNVQANTRSTTKKREQDGKKSARESSRLARYNKKPTITSQEIQTTVRLVLLIELAKHVVSEGTKAVTKFTSS